MKVLLKQLKHNLVLSTLKNKKECKTFIRKIAQQRFICMVVKDWWPSDLKEVNYSTINNSTDKEFTWSHTG